jgi:hypothetical protein
MVNADKILLSGFGQPIKEFKGYIVSVNLFYTMTTNKNASIFHIILKIVRYWCGEKHDYD